MKDLILITGASSGIGQELARVLAAKKYNLIIAARSIEKLQALKEELQTQYGVQVYVFQKDLAQAGAAQALYHDIRQQGLEVTMLVNNAGSGLYGNFSDTDLEAELRMMQLNMSSLVVLTKLFLQDMLVRKQGRIMQVASLLAFLPFPYYSVYSATKSFVLAFSETLDAELEGTGVTVTTLCPGPVDTPFNTDAMWKTKAYRSNKPIPASVVATQGAALLLGGRGKKMVGFNNLFISQLPRITPSAIMMKIKKSLASQQKHVVS